MYIVMSGVDDEWVKDNQGPLNALGERADRESKSSPCLFWFYSPMHQCIKGGEFGPQLYKVGSESSIF